MSEWRIWTANLIYNYFLLKLLQGIIKTLIYDFANFLLMWGVNCHFYSQKSSRDTTTPATSGGGASQGAVPGSDSGLTYSDSGSGSQPGFAYSDSGAGAGSGLGSGTGTGSGTRTGSEGTYLADGSWLAGLAMGDSTKIATPTLHTALIASSAFCIMFFSLRKL